MKLPEHVDSLRNLIESAFDKQFARLGFGSTKQIDLEKLPQELHSRRRRFEEMLQSHQDETGSYEMGREKLVDELTFTLFNRIAAVKVMEAADLFPPVITKETEHGDRSFGHKAWLEIRPDMRSEALEGIREYIMHAFNELGESLPLYSRSYPYALLPDPISLNEIIDAFNAVQKDPQVEDDIWQSDDVLGWLYESYNNVKKAAFKESKAKTEYDKVSLQSQVYTPRWVVQFLVDNSLGKLYLEMYPDSEIKKQYKIANAPQAQERERKALPEIKLIDPACGSGNFLLYAFDFFHALYLDQIENYDADYDEDKIPQLIIENNLHGIDLDDRAVQLAQLGLYIKARKKRRSVNSLHFNVVSSDFYLPDYETVRHIFEDESKLDRVQKELIADIWGDLQYAYKFGSLIRLEEKIYAKLGTLVAKREEKQPGFFTDEELGIKPTPSQGDLFIEQDIEQEKKFVGAFFSNLKRTVKQYARAEKSAFLASKTRDAITFLELLTMEYDVATANPPYTDSSDFGPDLKKFIEDNYKKPYKFHSNLYATFIKRCYDLVGKAGFVAMLHPLTFMYIKSFDGVREFILTKLNINLLAELGLGGVFAHSNVQVDVCMYVLKKGEHIDEGVYFDLKRYKNQTRKPLLFANIYKNFLDAKPDDHVFIMPQSKLKIIKSWPLIYWISDEFRKKFDLNTIAQSLSVQRGCESSNNNRFLKFWWEIFNRSINNDDGYYSYSKGGPYQKWFGNLWLTIDFRPISKVVIEKKGNLTSKQFYYKEGITSVRSGSKGPSYRFMPENCVFDNGGTSIFGEKYDNIFYALSYLNSSLANYVVDCLNPTVNTQIFDIKRMPFVIPNKEMENSLTILTKTNINIIKAQAKHSLIELEYENSPFLLYPEISGLIQKLKNFFNNHNHLLAQVLINEAIINENIFEVYDLTEKDKAMVLAKEGESIGYLPVLTVARDAYLAESEATKEFPLDTIRGFIASLPTREFSAEERKTIESDFPKLYQGNNDLEEYCIRHQVNPINVWYWFMQSNVIPQHRMSTLAMEFLADMIREILMEDEDGIIPLVPNAGEKILLERIEEKFREKGFSMAQYSSFNTVLGRQLDEYLTNHFFEVLSGHLKLFKRLPATPYIWHLSSGLDQGFDCYLIIYKWSRDKLMRIRSVYLERRERSLINRQSDLAGNESADAQNEKDKIFKQLKEIENFKEKIDKLLAEGYAPILDDGVGKNIAPLQKKKLIPYEVLNPGQLKKYLNADW